MLPAAGFTWLRYPLDIFSDRRLGNVGAGSCST